MVLKHGNGLGTDYLASIRAERDGDVRLRFQANLALSYCNTHPHNLASIRAFWSNVQ